MRGAVRRTIRRRVWGFPLLDLLLAALLCLVAVASVLTGNPDEGPLVITLPVAVVMTAAIAWRTRSPVTAVVMVIVASAVQTVLAMAPGSLWSLAVLAIVMYSVGAVYSEGRAAVVGGALVAALLIEERIDNGVDYLFILLLFGGLWLLGQASRTWRNRVGVAEQRQRDAARLASAEERVRIARELHDVVAHSLSVIAIQADAAEAALERDPARASEPVRVIRSTARSALTEIRGLLDVLRTEEGSTVQGGTDEGSPAEGSTDEGTDSPGLAAIEALVANARAAGIPVEYRPHRSDAAISPVVELTAYRAVQEGLTNVMRHAPGAATTVELEQGDAVLRIAVQNTAPVAPTTPNLVGAGYGLTGIRERVRAVGGRMDATSTPDGGYRLAVELPVHVPVRTEPTGGAR